MSLKTLELRNEREVWWCLYTQVRVQNVVKSKHIICWKKILGTHDVSIRGTNTERMSDK